MIKTLPGAFAGVLAQLKWLHSASTCLSLAYVFTFKKPLCLQIKHLQVADYVDFLHRPSAQVLLADDLQQGGEQAREIPVPKRNPCLEIMQIRSLFCP